MTRRRRWIWIAYWATVVASGAGCVAAGLQWIGVAWLTQAVWGVMLELACDRHESRERSLERRVVAACNAIGIERDRADQAERDLAEAREQLRRYAALFGFRFVPAEPDPEKPPS